MSAVRFYDCHRCGCRVNGRHAIFIPAAGKTQRVLAVCHDRDKCDRQREIKARDGRADAALNDDSPGRWAWQEKAPWRKNAR